MIAKLSGLIDSVNDDSVVIDVAGVGYLVFCSARTLGGLGAGQTVTLHIETHVREDHIHLYGFQSATERDWFRLLTTVQGVGNKVALAILSVLDGQGLMTAIVAADKPAFTQAPGVGPKLAGRIIGELKDKVGAIALSPIKVLAGAGAEAGNDAASGAIAGPTQDAVSALINLGYSPSDAFTAVAEAAGKMPDAGIEALIKAGLAELGPRESVREQGR